MLGQCPMAPTKHFDLESLDIDLHPGYCAILDDRVDRHHNCLGHAVRINPIHCVLPASESGSATERPGGGLNCFNRVAIEADIFPKQDECIFRWLQGDDLGANVRGPYRVTANVGADVNEQFSWLQDLLPYEHFRMVGRIGVDDLRRSGSVKVSPDSRPLSEPSQRSSA